MSREVASQTKNGLQKIFEQIEKDDKPHKVHNTFESISQKILKEKKYFIENSKFENIETINELIKNNEYKELCLLLRGDYYMKIGMPKEAIDDYSECIKYEYQLILTLHNRANAYIKIKEYEKAIQDMDTLENLLGEKKIECIYEVNPNY